MFKNLKLGQKLIFGFAAVIAIAVILAVVGINGIKTMSALGKNVADEKLPSVNSLQIMKEAQTNVRLSYIGLTNPRFSMEMRNRFYKNSDDALVRYNDARKIYDALQKSPEEAEVWKEFQPAWDAWMDEANTLFKMAQERDKMLAAGLSGNDPRVIANETQFQEGVVASVKNFDKAKGALNQAITMNINAASASAKTLAATDINTNRLMIIALILGVIIAFGLAIFFVNNISGIIRNLMNETIKLVDAAIGGKLAARADLKLIDSEFRPILDGFNQTLDAVIGPLNISAEYMDRISKGDIPQKITDNYNGDFNEIKNNLNNCINALNGLVAETTMLAKAADAGDLKTRGNAGKFEGSYKAIIQGMNDTLSAIVVPMVAVDDCLREMAKGNMDVWVNGDYKGDLLLIRNALNGTSSSINDILSSVTIAIEQVTSGSGQVSSSSQALAQSSNEAASSLEEITASIQELNSQTKQNADNAAQGNTLALNARGSAEKGAMQMKQMDKAMKEISESSASVSRIMKVIDEIAFQTNLLALNAAVEAARAGKHGKGFTVVAEEVRNLAQRSAKAAKETAELIEGSIKKTEVGTKIAEETSKSLEEIVIGATKVTDLIGEIASASKEQTLGLNQVGQGLGQLDQVTQQNSASAEESASASEELSSQALQLKQMISRFKLSKQSMANVAMASANTTGTVHNRHNAPAMVVAAGRKDGNGSRLKTAPGQIISLDDGGFDKF
jgi:methyl-accepting chemotaxis protein